MNNKKAVNVTRNHRKVQKTRKITMNVPLDLHLDFLQHVLNKYKSIYGHFNEELVMAIKGHLENEKTKKKK